MPARILLVEDDNYLRNMFAQFLAQAGYEVVEPANGRVAMEKMAEKSADMIITNMVLPEMDGVEIIMAIRRRYPGVKIVALAETTLNPAENFLKIARMLGAQRTLAKPLAPEQLLHAVQDLLASK
jgi:DNA-binding response OmpR family regulator